jgi:peptide/nickel transport system substrate-binding protein
LGKLRWQILVVSLALVAIAVLLLSQKQPLISEGENSNQPVAGGTYSEAVVGTPVRLNPLFDQYNPVDYDVDRLVYCNMVRFDNRGLPHGDLAETWGISRDGKAYSFSIRPNALWHDGQAVTSEDVIFTIDLLRNDAVPVPEDVRAFWKQIEVTALDQKTLQFRLPEPYSPFLDFLNFGILPKHILGNLEPADLVNANFNLQPVGCGPFQFDGLSVQDGKISALTLTPFKNYFGKKPFLEKLEFHFFPDAGNALAAYERGEVMGVSQITQDLLPQALKNENLNVFTSRLPLLYQVYLNLDNADLPFFKDLEVRKALYMGINRQWMIDRLLGGQGILATGPILPNNWAYYEGVEKVDYDPERAIEILRRAGYTFPAEGGKARTKDGVALAFELTFPDQAPFPEIANQLKEDWGRMGVEVTLNPVAYDSLLKDYLKPRTYQAALVDLDFSRSPDPDPYPFWHQAQITSGQNYAQWDDRQVSEYLEQARVLVDFDERIKRYRNFQVRFAAEQPALPLFYPVYSYGVDRKVSGVSMGPLYDPSDRFTNILNWYLKTGTAAKDQTTATAGP